jgi:hypothetical protein
LKEGQTLSESVTYIQKPLLQAGNKSLNLKDLKEPYYLNPNLQKDFVEQIRFEHPIPLQVLMAYSDKNEILNLTDKVDKNGKLNWTALKVSGSCWLYLWDCMANKSSVLDLVARAK